MSAQRQCHFGASVTITGCIYEIKVYRIDYARRPDAGESPNQFVSDVGVPDRRVFRPAKKLSGRFPRRAQTQVAKCSRRASPTRSRVGSIHPDGGVELPFRSRLIRVLFSRVLVTLILRRQFGTAIDGNCVISESERECGEKGTFLGIASERASCELPRPD